MEAIIETFGIDARLIVIQIINFAVLMAALWYFLYAPVLKILKEREDKIKRGISDAEEAAKARETAEAEKRAMMTAATQEAEEIASRAKSHAEVKAAEIVSGAQDKAANVLKDAEEKGEELKARARKESEAEISKLAILAAERVLRERSS